MYFTLSLHTISCITHSPRFSLYTCCQMHKHIFHRVTRTVLRNTNVAVTKTNAERFYFHQRNQTLNFFTTVYVFNVEGIKLDYSKSASQYT